MKRTVSLLMTLLSVTLLTAHQLTSQQALNRISSGTSAAKGLGAATATDYTLAYSSVRNGTATYYAFNKPGKGGFVVLSADDCMPAILVESDDTASFNADNMPDGLRYWLAEYDKVISQYAAEGKTYTSSLTSYDEISPLLETNGMNTAWSQHAPYNNMCPLYNGHVGLTGCVATATAQIMRYHQWPTTGTGSKTYDYKFEYVYNDKKDTSYVDMQASTDFSRHTYDWSNMKDTYDGVTTTETEKNAVAQLMYDCGVAAEMEYGNYGSASANIVAISGLVDHFGYDASVTQYPRNIFTDTEWENLIYNELSNGRPILYSGSDNEEGGHAFVCDGYKDGLYHMNWGWGGQDNCYVLMVSSDTEPAISAVEPNKTIYASFNVNQAACLNIMPDNGGTISSQIKMVCAEAYTPCKYNSETGSFVQATTFQRTKDVYLSGDFYNACYRARNYQLGIKASSSSNTYFLPSYDFAVSPGYGFSAIGASLLDILVAGQYTLTPVYKDLSAGDTEWKEMTMRSDITKPTITISSFTADTKPYMLITEMPVISTNNGTTTTSDNQVLKTNGKVDIGISVKAKILNPTKVSFYVSSRSYFDYHTLHAYIYDYETGKFRAVMYCTSEETSAGRTVTLSPTTRYTDVNVDDSLEVGSQYIMEFIDMFRPIESGAHYTQTTVPDYTSQFLPNTEYQDIVFKVVDKITTGIEEITATEPKKETPSVRKVLKNGQLIIIRGDKRYSIDGKQLQ